MMNGDLKEQLSFGDLKQLEVPQHSPIVRITKQKSQTRLSMPAMKLRASLKKGFESKKKGVGSSSRRNKPVDDGIAVLDSILQSEATSSRPSLEKSHFDQLVKLKESLENLDNGSSTTTKQQKKKSRSPSLVHRAYLNEEWGMGGGDSSDDDDVVLGGNNYNDHDDEGLDGDTHSSTESSSELQPPNCKPNGGGGGGGNKKGGDTGMNVLFAFGAMPASTTKARRSRALIDSRRASSSLLQLTPRQRGHKKHTRLQKLASRRVSSLTHKVQSHAPKEWYEIIELSTKKKLARLLSWEKLAQWDFDVFEIAKLTNGHPLLFIGWAILSSPYSQHVMEEVLLERSQRRPVPFELMEGYRFIDHFQIDQKKMTNFLRTMEKEYFDENPYHNNTHAADVLQTLHSMLQGMGGVDVLQPASIQLFAVLLSAVIHDVGHPGYNNFFQQSSHSDIALCYNDQSILENMHLALAFRKLLGGRKKESINIFANMERDDVAMCRKLMVEAVLGTDMSKHFQSVIAVKKSIASINANANANVDEGPPDDETTWEILHYMMHAADISNGAKRKDIAIQWADRCLDEFFRQGDTEKKMGIPVSPLCDRDYVSRPESQSGFIEFIIKPTFEVLVKILPNIGTEIIPQLDTNLAFWNSQIPEKVVHDLEQLRDDFERNEGILQQQQQQQQESDCMSIPPPPPPPPPLENGLTTIPSFGAGATWEDISEEFSEDFSDELIVSSEPHLLKSLETLGHSSGECSAEEFSEELIVSSVSREKLAHLKFRESSSIQDAIIEESHNSNSDWSSNSYDSDSQSVYEC